MREDNSGEGAKQGKRGKRLGSEFNHLKVHLTFLHNEINTVTTSPGLDEIKYIFQLYQWENKTC